jgi:hypothetical protein
VFEESRLEELMTVDELRTRALELPREERELLGIAQLSSLETAANQAEVDTAWADEIQARPEAYHSGQVDALEGSGTVERIRQRLAARIIDVLQMPTL